MKCPECKSKALVVDVRTRNGITARKRVCTKCKCKFYTKESTEGGYDAYKIILKTIECERARNRQTT